MKPLRILWLRWQYGLERANAYLAEHMGEMDVVANHELHADRIWLKWWRESIADRRPG